METTSVATAKKKNKINDLFVAHQTGLKEGVTAPSFQSSDQHGNAVSLADFKGKTLVLYFYPKDDTPACTASACNLRDEHARLKKNNYAVAGVSADTQRSHAKFAAKYSLPFPLLADTDKHIIKAYDVWGPKMLFGRIYEGIVRTTFIIGPDGVIQKIIRNVDNANHAGQVLEG